MPIRGSRPTVEKLAFAGSASEANRRFAVGLARAFGGAILFSIPVLMTMEMWWLGFSMDPLRLAIFILLNIPLLAGLAYYAGFETTYRDQADIRDAFIACAIGFAVAALLLRLFAIIGPGMSADEIIGKIAVQAVPASIGAMLARSQFDEGQQKEEKRRSSDYGSELFLMAVGALYLSSGLAPTEELVVISYKMTPGQVVGLLVFSLVMMHGLVRAEATQGKLPVPPDIPFWPMFLRFTIVGYSIALLISVFTLWIFERTGGLGVGQAVQATIVLGFPAALGAGAARLLL